MYTKPHAVFVVKELDEFEFNCYNYLLFGAKSYKFSFIAAHFVGLSSKYQPKVLSTYFCFHTVLVSFKSLINRMAHDKMTLCTLRMFLFSKFAESNILYTVIVRQHYAANALVKKLFVYF